MSDETFKVLDTQNQEQGQCFWSCRSCHSYALKFDKRMRNVETRVTKLESETVPNIVDDVAGLREDLTNLKKVFDEKEPNVVDENKCQSTITAAVLEEMRERESRRCNLIIHNLTEPSADVTESKERMEKDIEKLRELIGLIEVQVDLNDAVRFAKRLGPRNDDDETPRPLLVGLKEKQHCDSVLDKSHKLSEMEDPWSSVHIIRDLTKTQRKEEKEMRIDVDKKNHELSEEEKGNWEWKVVGRRGERKIVKVEVKEEQLSQEEGGSGRGRGRGRGRPHWKRLAKK